MKKPRQRTSADAKQKTTARESKRKTGRPEIQIDEAVFAQLCQLQCTEVELAAFFKCSKRTIIRKLKEPKFRELWELGKAMGRISLRRLQWRHAKQSGSAGVQMTIHLSKHWLGEHDRNVEMTLEQLEAEIARRERDLAEADDASAE